MGLARLPFCMSACLRFACWSPVETQKYRHILCKIGAVLLRGSLEEVANQDDAAFL